MPPTLVPGLSWDLTTRNQKTLWKKVDFYLDLDKILNFIEELARRKRWFPTGCSFSVPCPFRDAHSAALSGRSSNPTRWVGNTNIHRFRNPSQPKRERESTWEKALPNPQCFYPDTKWLGSRRTIWVLLQHEGGSKMSKGPDIQFPIYFLSCLCCTLPWEISELLF